MDVVVPLLLMAIFYLGPALLKRYRAKDNTQSTIPDLLNAETMNASSYPEAVASNMASATVVQPSMVVTHSLSAPAIVGEQSAWQGKLDQNSITNGVIFAEILQPPRAYRPFVKR